MTVTTEPPVEAPDAGVIDDARARERRHRAVGAAATLSAVGVFVLAFGIASGGGQAGASHHTSAPGGRPLAARLDARWSSLRRCLSYVEQHPDLNGYPEQGGTVQTVGSTRLQVFSDPSTRFDGLIGVFAYEGTFARAQAAARAKKKQPRALHGVGTTAGLAIGNVTYYLTGWGSTPQITIVTGCLSKTFAGQPRYPAHLDVMGPAGSRLLPQGI